MLIKKPGARILKTGLGLFLSMLTSSLREGGLPFYSGITAIICMQQDVAGTFYKGLYRALGTIIGGLTGLGYLLIAQKFALSPRANILILSIIVTFLIWILATFEKNLAITIAGIVFLSVTINHAHDAKGPVIFALNRIIDTLIGVFTSLYVNWADFEIRKRYHNRFDKNHEKTWP